MTNWFKNAPVIKKHRKKFKRPQHQYVVEFVSTDCGKLYAFGTDCMNIQDGDQFVRLKFNKPWVGAVYYDDDQRRIVVAKSHKRQQKHKKFRFGWEYHSYWGKYCEW